MSALIIANTQIRCDSAGRFCLNDLHQASGGEARHRPGRWLDSEKTRELIAEVACPTEQTAGIPAVSDPVVTHEGRLGGTYVVKELVYAYAMWISAAFHLHVIRAYDALVNSQPGPVLLTQPQHRADQLVSAGRIFSAALRTARGLRMTPSRSMQAAFDCTIRHTGIDWAQELDITAAEIGPAVDPLVQQVRTQLEGRTETQLAELARSLHMRNPDNSGTLARLGNVLHGMGWRRHRSRVSGGTTFRTLWRPQV